MSKIELRKCIERVADVAVFSLAIMGAVVASAQTVSKLQYKTINGQIYSYESSKPASMYLVSNPTPEQIGLGADAKTEEKKLDANNKGTGVFPYNANRRAYGRSYILAPIPARAAESNSALPAVTFRNPTVSLQYQPRTNSIGGLPRYPGKNYYPGDEVAP